MNASVLIIFGSRYAIYADHKQNYFNSRLVYVEIIGKKSPTVVCFLFCLVRYHPAAMFFPFYMSNEIVFVKTNLIVSSMFVLYPIVIKYRRCYLIYMFL